MLFAIKILLKNEESLSLFKQNAELQQFENHVKYRNAACLYWLRQFLIW